MRVFLERKKISLSANTVHKYMNDELQLYSTQSMSKAGYPYDNAPMERYYNILKNELIYLHEYRTDEELNTAIEEFAYTWYNHVRPHSYNGYRTPFEARYRK